MPTNVTAEYKKAEQAFRAAREPRDRLACLREMLRTIPKHKGTDHLQADIKSRIKQLTEELAGPKKGARRTAPAHTVRPEGAAQIALIGPPNSGKSSLHAQLTGSHADIAPYPYTTKLPLPGMAPFEDIHFQWVDLPPLSKDFMESWYVNALQPAHAALLIVDISDPECIEQTQFIIDCLAAKKITLESHWPGLESSGAEASKQTFEANSEDSEDSEDLADPFHIHLPTVLIANKCDLDPEPAEIEVLQELLGTRFPAIATSVTSGVGLDAISPLLFRGLEIVRVYTKTPGKPPERERPFTVRRGGTVLDVAQLVHKDIAETLKFARLWGKSGQFAGQQVGPEHEVADGDVVELHV